MRGSDRPGGPVFGTTNAAPRGSSIKDAKKPKPGTRLKPRRVELVRPIYQPSVAELEELIMLPQMSLEEAARRLMAPVETYRIAKPRHEI